MAEKIGNIYEVFELENVWENQEDSYPRDSVQIFLSSDNLDVVVKNVESSKDLVFTLEEWTAAINFIADQLRKEGYEDDEDEEQDE